MNKLLSELKKDYAIIQKEIPESEDKLIILLSKATYTYLGSFKVDSERHLIYNTDIKSLTVYELSHLAKLLEDYSNEIL